MLKTKLIPLRRQKNRLGFNQAAIKLTYRFLTLSSFTILGACATTSGKTVPPGNCATTSGNTSPSGNTVLRKDMENLLNSTAGKSYVAFAGGGWRAHTGHAAWMVGLLDNKIGGNSPNIDLDTAFQNISTISSNSGGSWFNVMLSYSDKFRDNLENVSARTRYIGDPLGYYQHEKRTFQNITGGKSVPELCKLTNYLSHDLAIACLTDLNWEKLVEEVVFEPLCLSSDLKNVTLSGKQAWKKRNGKDKEIILASTALLRKAVLTDGSFPDLFAKYYYDAQSLNRRLNIVPVAFTSELSISGAAPQFFLGAPAKFDMTYAAKKTIFTHPKFRQGNVSALDSRGVNVIDAAAASSAALGFFASAAINENNDYTDIDAWGLANEARDLAINFDLPAEGSGSNAIFKSTTPPKASNSKNANAGYIKLADGGPMDNSGVAHSVWSHQSKYQANIPFEIIAFDNVLKTHPGQSPPHKTADVGIDIANLFGFGFGTARGSADPAMCAETYCIKVGDAAISPKIFDKNGLVQKAAWSATIPSEFKTSKPCELIYTPYTVTTIDNHMLGIKKGYKGTLHSFTAHCPSAGTAPLDEADWTAYKDMFLAIQKGLKDPANPGLPHLRRAFGLH